MEQKDKIRLKAELLLLFVAFNWGLSFPLIKITLNFISPHAFVFIRFGIKLLLFMLIYPKIFKNIKWIDLKYGLILGIFVYIGFITQTIGLVITTAQKSAFITGTYVVILPFIQYFIIKKVPRAENITGVILVTIGLIFLTQVQYSNFNIGDFFTLICALFFAIHIVYLDKFLNQKGADYKALVLGQFLVMTVFGFISMTTYEIAITDDFFIIYDTAGIIYLLYTAIVCTLIAWIIINRYQGYTSPVKAGIIYSMELVFAVFAAYLIINETLAFDQIIGAVIMVSGMVISEFYGYIRSKRANN